MAGTGSPRRRTPARRVLVGAARIAALLAIIVGVCGVLVPALTYRPAFYAVALAFAVISFVLLQPRQQSMPPAALLPPAPPAPVVIVDEARVEAAREEERERWAAEVSKSIDAVRRAKQDLTSSEESRSTLARNLDELTQTILTLREQTSMEKAAATQKVVHADSLVAELNAQLTAAREAADALRTEHAQELERFKQAFAKREADWSEKFRKATETAEADHQRALAQRDTRINELQRALESERGVREQVANLARELQQQLTATAAAQGDLSRAMDQERSARERFEANARDLATRLHDVEQERDALRAEIVTLRQSIDTERNAHREAVAQRDADFDSQLRDVTEKHNVAREEARSLAARIAGLEQQGAARETEWNEKLQHIGDAVAQRDSAHAEVRELSGRIEALQREHATREAEWNEKLQHIVSGMAADHENDIGTAIEERESARAEVRELSGRIEALQREHAAREAEWNEKLQHVVSGMAADHENDIGTAIEERETARAELRELSGRIEQLQREHAAREAEWNEKLQKIVSGMAADHENDIGEATMEREAARAEARHLTMRLQEVQRQVEDLRLATVDEKALREKIDAEWSEKLQTIVTHLASDHDEDIGKALEEKEEAKAEVRTLSMKVGKLQDQIERDRQIFLAAQEKWNTLRDSLQKQIDDLRRPGETDPFPTARIPTPEPFPSPFGSAPAAEVQRSRADVLEIAEQAHAVLKRTSIPGTIPVPRPDRRALILFVHHDPTMRTMWRDQLHKNGYDVVTAADGLEGLRIATAQKPEVIIADAQMPKMDGRELCQLIKSNEQTASTKVVLLTGMQTVETPKEGFQPDELLRKPVKFEALQTALATLVGAAS